jgi:hypothetical protein
VEEAGFATTGRKVVHALGLTGIMNINAIRDAQGRDWIHDVNPRAFGSFMGFRPAGVDLLQDYVDWILQGAMELAPSRCNQEASSSTEKSYPVFPAAFRSHGSTEGLVRSYWRFAKGAQPYVRWVGPHYVAYETGRQLPHEMGRLLDRHDKRSVVRRWMAAHAKVRQD